MNDFRGDARVTRWLLHTGLTRKTSDTYFFGAQILPCKKELHEKNLHLQIYSRIGITMKKL